MNEVAIKKFKKIINFLSFKVLPIVFTLSKNPRLIDEEVFENSCCLIVILWFSLILTIFFPFLYEIDLNNEPPERNLISLYHKKRGVKSMPLIICDKEN